MKVVAKNLPAEDIENYTQMFQMIDKDKDGTLTLEELKEGLRINGHAVPENLFSMEKGVKSTLPGSPRIISVTISAVPSAKASPLPSCPVAIKTFDISGTNPITGFPSGM
uniref:EF-hand domain-containing protein n=1 Tax=Aegilops tauschii subsp. strangulata TaxID=200361 RepID=A0A453LB53_AEGTS